ncbi:MAG: dihydrofolate reductase family protein [Archangium sp.]
MRPHITCHMISSVDGRTQTRHWPGDTAKVFEETAATIKCDGWIVGRTTMAEFCEQSPRRKRSGRFDVPKKDFIAPHHEETYAIGLDPSGKLHWKHGNVDTEHAVMIVTEKVSGDYLEHLQRAGVSYLFGGKTTLDLKLVAEKLYRLLGIRRVTVQGGGSNNGSWLNEGLVDEISLVVMPFADGKLGLQSVFDIEADQFKAVHQLKLISSTTYKKQYVWLRYSVK